jgi:hypothetical protein
MGICCFFGLQESTISRKKKEKAADASGGLFA